MPEFRFKVVKKYKDCLSRQLGEALSIFTSKDKLLNSKNEYISNCISRLAVQEGVVEKKRREMREEVEEREALEKLKKFKEQKSDGGVSCSQGGGTPQRKLEAGECSSPAKRAKIPNFNEKLSYFKNLENSKKQHQDQPTHHLAKLNLLRRGESFKAD